VDFTAQLFLYGFSEKFVHEPGIIKLPTHSGKCLSVRGTAQVDCRQVA
jgi:hypothetical protein